MPSFQAWKICTFNEFSFLYSQSCSFRNSDNCVKFQCLIFIKTTFTQPSNQSSDSWSPLSGHPEEMYRKTEQNVLPFFSFSPSSARLTTSLWRSYCRARPGLAGQRGQRSLSVRKMTRLVTHAQLNNEISGLIFFSNYSQIKNSTSEPLNCQRI